MKVGVHSYLPVASRIDRRIWVRDPIDLATHGDFYWDEIPKEEAKLLLNMIIGIFSYSEDEKEIEKSDMDIAFYLENPDIFGEKFAKNPLTLAELQGIEVIFDGKIYKLPKIWKI